MKLAYYWFEVVYGNYYNSSFRNNDNVADNVPGTLLTIDLLIYNTYIIVTNK